MNGNMPGAAKPGPATKPGAMPVICTKTGSTTTGIAAGASMMLSASSFSFLAYSFSRARSRMMPSTLSEYSRTN
eukprot:EC784925.1.p2 GENE.EC784925.1~~EC784925.1.p2  ORF type:complete len:74 (-),score=16.11 EC784925.1:16-237(-)